MIQHDTPSGLLTTRQAVTAINESGRLQRSINHFRFNYIAASRNIAPDQTVTRFHYWSPATVERVLAVLVAAEEHKRSIVGRTWKLKKPLKSKKPRKSDAEQTPAVPAADASADAATVSAV
jgi:hypothetical protein